MGKASYLCDCVSQGLMQTDLFFPLAGTALQPGNILSFTTEKYSYMSGPKCVLSAV